MQQLIQALEDYIEPYLALPVFHDRTGLEAGDIYDVKFGEALCQSVCMVAVYTPTYFDRVKTYCTREYVAMERIERHRIDNAHEGDLAHTGLIIPIVLKGSPPSYITDRRHCMYDFSRFTLRSDDISKHEEYSQWFDAIGRQVRHLYDTQMVACVETQSPDFVLPGVAEVLPLLDDILPDVAQVFPGRAVYAEV